MRATSIKATLLAASLIFPAWSFAQTKSKDAAAYANRGIARLKKNDWDGAIADANRALQFDPKLAAAYAIRGDAKVHKGELDSAIAEYNRTLTLDPKLAKAYDARGLAKLENYNLTVYGGVDNFLSDYDLGILKIEKGNLDGAFADFNRALHLDPKLASAYANRGIAKTAKGDVEGAIADCSRALAVDPKYALAHLSRGVAKEQKGDLDGAIADYDQALNLNSKLANAHVDRGTAKILKGDTDGAIADLNHALQLNPKLGEAYNGRGAANFLARSWMAALRDYRRFCELSQRNQEYARLSIWMIRSRLGEREAADKELATHFSAAPGSWVSKIRAYLLGNLSEGEFLAAVSPGLRMDPRQRCEAWFYVGMKNLLDGNKPAATEFFKKCVATGQNSISEYHFAKAELKALGQ